MNLIHIFRTILKIRVERQLPPIGPMPIVGSSIVRGKARIRLQSPIDRNQWEWLSEYGWRTVDMRTDRRHYFRVPQREAIKFLIAAPHQRAEFNLLLEKWANRLFVQTKAGKARLRSQSA